MRRGLRLRQGAHCRGARRPRRAKPHSVFRHSEPKAKNPFFRPMMSRKRTGETVKDHFASLPEKETVFGIQRKRGSRGGQVAPNRFSAARLSAPIKDRPRPRWTTPVEQGKPVVLSHFFRRLRGCGTGHGGCELRGVVSRAAAGRPYEKRWGRGFAGGHRPPLRKTLGAWFRGRPQAAPTKNAGGMGRGGLWPPTVFRPAPRRGYGRRRRGPVPPARRPRSR